MLRSRPRVAVTSFALLLAVLLLATACGDDGDDGAAPDGTTTTDAADEVTTTSTTSSSPDDPDETTTTTESSTPSDQVAAGSLTTAGGVTTDWTLSASATALCFEADLSHPDPAVSDSIGDGVADCLEPDGGLDQLDSGLSVDVGTVDGEKTIGFLWGRVAADVTSLTIRHTDGTQTPIEIVDGPTDVGVFAYVVEVSTIPPVQDLEAAIGTEVAASTPIRGFLRAGPTYPVATPPPSTTTPAYPVS